VYRHDVMVRIAAVRVVAIVRADSAGTAEQVGRAVLGGGLDVVEVALTTPDGLEALRVLAADAPDAVLGAGTVLDAATARLAILAGARFIVSPGSTPAWWRPRTATARRCYPARRPRPRWSAPCPPGPTP
jgi:2-dehydro-3-deoxyphosphogluconate aldolase / (4S)-4-hydroxy-2-oxoglutarate aldolase